MTLFVVFYYMFNFDVYIMWIPQRLLQHVILLESNYKNFMMLIKSQDIIKTFRNVELLHINRKNITLDVNI